MYHAKFLKYLQELANYISTSAHHWTNVHSSELFLSL